MIIGIHCNTRNTRELRTWDKFPEFCQRLVDKYRCTLVFTGSNGDKDYVYQIMGEVRGQTTDIIGCSLDELISMMETFKLYITVNTLPMHIAMSNKIPTLALIGGTAAEVLVKNEPNFWYIEARDLICNNITVEEVMRKVGEILD